MEVISGYRSSQGYVNIRNGILVDHREVYGIFAKNDQDSDLVSDRVLLSSFVEVSCICGFRMFKRMVVMMLINLMVKGRLRSEMVCVCQRLFWILLKVSGFTSKGIAGK